LDISDKRPDPDEILKEIRDEEKERKGKLKIFLGYAAGVGKTYAMLDEAHEQYKAGIDVIVGYVEPHTRPDTMRILEGLPTIPPQDIEYKNMSLKEFDLDAALKRKPDLILVDELAHTNAHGARNKKRYQDIEELLNAGIDVYTTVNVQHIESLNDIVQDATKIAVKETVPNYIFDMADSVKLIDIDPDKLLTRLEEGKIYSPERAKKAMQNFFIKENLTLLREISMRKAADRISYSGRSGHKTQKNIANTKWLVCVGASSSSAKSIRWTARAAEAFHAPWIAVYVETPENEYMSKEKTKSIRANIDLAERLGAEITTLVGQDIASTIAEYVSLSGITNIVIGKNKNRKTLLNYFRPTFENKLINLLPDIEIHIVPGNDKEQPYKKSNVIKLEDNFQFSWADTLKTLGLLISATLISLVLGKFDTGNQNNTIMVYILSILIVSRVTTGYAYGIIASTISMVSFNFFFVEPFFSFKTIHSNYPITFFIMLMVTIITSTLTVRVKSQARQAVEREQRTDMLYDINKKLLVTRGLDNIVTLTNNYIVNLLGRSVIFYTADPKNGINSVILQASDDADASFMESEEEKAVANWALVNHKLAGAGTDTLMGAGAFYIPVVSQGKALGVLGISCIQGAFGYNRRLLMRMIASQVAMALERQYLSDEQRHILVESEKEKMRSNLLGAISHDLLTPLNGILSSSNTIIDHEDQLNKETENKLLSKIKEDAQWLIRMVENLILVTRINEGTISLAKTPVITEIVVGEALGYIRKRFPDRSISVKMPGETQSVPMDASLISQVLINLLENSIKHSPATSEIEVSVKRMKDVAVFEVNDNESDISEKDLSYLFDDYEPSEDLNEDSSNNIKIGIGLSICKSIIKAHSGKMEAIAKKTGGTSFRFILPLDME